MRLNLTLAGLLLRAVAGGAGGGPALITIPSVSGPLVIDGRLDEAFWGEALPIGEARVATRGAFLCLGVRVPERGRVVAHSTGHNPAWWSEDLVTWTFRVQSAALRRNVNLSLTVNPLGAFRFEGAGAERLLVAAALGRGEWTAEAAIPLDLLDRIGFVTVVRVRAPRPDAPELRRYWPAAHESAAFRLAALNNSGTPAFQPPELPAREPTRAPDSALAWIPPNAWSEGQRVSGMVEKAQRRRVAQIAGEEKRAWQQVDSRTTWKRFRDARLAALRRWIGPFPERTPLRAAITRRASWGDGFVVENVVFESRPHLLVTANLYRPEAPGAKIPAIVVVHSHHAPKVQTELQDLGMTWARAGTAVLIMDQLCAGERLQSQPWPRESYYGRYALGNQLYLAGESLVKWMAWDLMRGIDLLLERPYIDPKRIVMLGAVAGGGDPAALTAALDARIAAVIPFNFGEAGPEEHYTEGPRPYDFDTAAPGWGSWETTRNLPRSIRDQFFPWFLCASVAPRPFLYAFEVAWPQDVEREPVWARYKKVFEFYRARDRLGEVHGFGPFPGPGECTNVGTFLRKQIYPILERWLAAPAPSAEYHHPLPDAELMCLTPALAAERQPRAASTVALEIARQRLSSARAERDHGANFGRALAEKLGEIEPVPNPPVRALWTKSGPDARVEAFSIETEPGIVLPVLLLRPVTAAARGPAVLALAEGGKARFLAERGQDLLTLLRRGIAVCLPDVRGTGEAGGGESRGPRAMAAASTELMLGRTMLGARLKDARTVFRFLASRPDIDSTRLGLWGDSFAEVNPDDFAFDQSDMQQSGPFAQHQAEPLGTLLALLTALYEDGAAAVAGRGGLVSFLSVLEDRFCHVPQDVIVPGILATADISDIVTAEGARPVRLERLVDGRDRLAPGKGPGEPGLAAWLAAQVLRR